MDETSRCSQCINKELCYIRSNLSRIIKEVIKNSEAEVQQLSPKEIDYLIYTDISIIPTRCENFKCRQEVPEEREPLFTFTGTTQTIAVYN